MKISEMLRLFHQKRSENARQIRCVFHLHFFALSFLKVEEVWSRSIEESVERSVPTPMIESILQDMKDEVRVDGSIRRVRVMVTEETFF